MNATLIVVVVAPRVLEELKLLQVKPPTLIRTEIAPDSPCKGACPVGGVSDDGLELTIRESSRVDEQQDHLH